VANLLQGQPERQHYRQTLSTSSGLTD
jgi:hypothetical protein